MRESLRAHHRRVDQGLGKAVLKGLTTVITGPARMAKFDPPLYPRDAQSRDLERIGRDMYSAFGTFSEELRRPNAEATQIESEEPIEGGGFPSPEVLESLSESVRAAAVESAVSADPLPPPTMYRAYNEVLPGSAECVLKMAEKEQDRRIGRENEALHRASQQDHLGLWLGSLIAALALVSSGLLAMNGHDWVAGIVGCTVLAGAAAGLIRECRGPRRFLG